MVRETSAPQKLLQAHNLRPAIRAVRYWDDVCKIQPTLPDTRSCEESVTVEEKVVLAHGSFVSGIVPSVLGTFLL